MIENTESILFFAVHVGEVMLRSGAETYRVEDTIVRILSSHDFVNVDTFVTPTVIIATVHDGAHPVSSTLRRIKNRSTRLDKIELANQLSRDYVNGQLSFAEATTRLKAIDTKLPYAKKWIVLANAFSSGFFSLMFNGRVAEFIIAFCTGLVVAQLQSLLRAKEIVNYFVLFIVSLFIGVVIAVTTLIAPELFNTEAIVIGCIMSLVPGVAFTNAIRDTIGDELLSGISRGVEALFIAIAIAAGVGLPMSIGLFIGGLL